MAAPAQTPPRAAAAATVLAVLIAGAVVGAVRAAREPGPRPDFQLPVACGETWRLTTYRGHDDFDIDLFPTVGSPWERPVLASAPGEVVTAGLQGELGAITPATPDGEIGSGAGWPVKIDHGGGWESLYLHMIAQPTVAVGDRVERGQLLGTVGSTGRSSAPHLHYEQRVRGEKVEAVFAGVPSGITHDDVDYGVTRVSGNC
jgi:murein DD-endopeptidase MepM/ murein hydrolase activator NlpD